MDVRHINLKIKDVLNKHFVEKYKIILKENIRYNISLGHIAIEIPFQLTCFGILNVELEV